MKKLIFKKFFYNTLKLFFTSLILLSLIVWTLQAVNFFDFVTEDGHGLKVYFAYTILNLPKIIHRVLPFVFFISLFYIIINYETKNEFSIFWINGINKISFFKLIIIFSIIIMIFQIILGSYLSPNTQFKGRNYLKNSNIDFFTSLLKEKKFINVVKGLTIFIDEKNYDGSYKNIFLEDSTKNISRTIYAKKGVLVENGKKKTFQLFEGRMMTNEKEKINIFNFEKINFDLSKFSSNTIIVPKIQEINSINLILGCFIKINLKISQKYKFKCQDSLKKDALQELLKRFYKPIYIPVIASICGFLIIFSNSHKKYIITRNLIFIITLSIIIISEVSLRYSTYSIFSLGVYLSIPFLLFVLAYSSFCRLVRNV